LRLLAHSARGSMRDALSLLDQAIAYGAGKVAESEVRAMLGAIDDEFLYSIAEALARGDAKGAFAAADAMQERNVSFDAALRDLASLLHRVALAQTAPAALTAEGAERDRLLALARALDPEDVQLHYQIAIHGRQDLPFAPDEYAGFTMALLRMLAFRTDTDPGSRRAAPDAAGKPVPAQASAAKVAPAPSQADWPSLVLKLTGLAGQLAQASELRRFEGDAIELRLPPASKHLAEKNYQDKLKAALDAHFGRPIRLSVGIGETAGNTARDRASAAISGDAFVKDLMENFDATIVESSIKPTR
jgi:DNA polymerase III subunit gamma/tau